MATTVRIPDPLKDEAAGYAARLGISINALIAVALRDYLDGRRDQVPAQAPAPVAVQVAAPPPKPYAGGKALRRVKRRKGR